MSVNAQLTRDCFDVNKPCNVELVITCDRDLAVGDTVEVQFPNSWSLVSGPSHTRPFQTDDPAAPHYVQVAAEGVVAEGTDAQFGHSITPHNLNYLGRKSRHGRLVAARLQSGSVPAGTRLVACYANTLAAYITDAEEVWVRVKGEAPAEPPVLRTVGGPCVKVRVIVPSGVEPGQEFDVLIVSLDEFDNASSDTFEGRTLRLANDGSAVAEGLTFTGTTRVPVSLDEPGVYRFTMDDVVSNAVKVEAGRCGPFWGDTHIHTKLSSDAQGGNPYPYARDVSGLDFGAAIDHWDSLGPEGYRILEEWAEADNEPGRFATIFGDERNPPALTGHHNTYFRTLDALRRHQAIPGDYYDDPAAEAEYLATLDPQEVMIIPHHTGMSWGRLQREGIGTSVDWDAWADPGLRPVMEIYSHHGQSDTYAPQHALAYEFNRMRNVERRANCSTPGPFYAQEYWKKGLRIGCIGSSDQHTGQGGRPHGGIAAVWADELERSAVFDAIRARQCYGTTGEHILVEFDVDGVTMGNCTQAKVGDTVKLTLKVWGTDILVRVEILRLRFGIDDAFVPISSESPRLEADHTTHLGTGPRPETMDAVIEIEDQIDGPCVYYARVTQEPLEWPDMAWTSPVWIDVV
jgi:uncharacterized protein DUF3604